MKMAMPQVLKRPKRLTVYMAVLIMVVFGLQTVSILNSGLDHRPPDDALAENKEREQGQKHEQEHRKKGTLKVQLTVTPKTAKEKQPEQAQKLNQHRVQTKKKKLIYMSMGRISSKNLGGCPDWNCDITSDQKRLEESDAIISTYPMRYNRRPSQFVVYFSQESPSHQTAPSDPDYFNFTMSYRLDSDFPVPYGYVEARESKYSQKYRFTKKKKSVAWIVSNCVTVNRRMEYVQALRRFIDIDIYGRCSNIPCSRTNNNEDCNRMIESKYYFYLSLENSNCKDYITEKYYSWVNRNIVVVVMKRSIMEGRVPDNSYIAIDDFPSPRHLALYLKTLIKHPMLYQQYFKWRTKYNVVYLDGVVHDERERPWGFCRLCAALWKQPPLQKVYHDMSSWWNAKQDCNEELPYKAM